jgi:spore germination protein GerM
MEDNEKNLKVFILPGTLLVVLLVLVIVFFTGGEREKIRHAPDSASAKSRPAAAEPAAKRTVTLFFLSDDDELLHGESRDIVAGPTAAAEAEATLAELLKGSTADLIAPLPGETRLRQVFVGADGVATVDFSKDIMEKYSYGSTSELAAVYAVVDTLAYNFKAIKKVSIVVEGAERETLGGHIDLTRPFLPDYSLVAK